MPDSLRCDICSSTFQRREHYQRHLRTHTREKPFTCSECKQSFGRVDSLARHHASIHVNANRQTDSDQPNIRRRVAQACNSCSTSKVRCDGEKPCQRCREHETECVYEPASKRMPTNNGSSDRARAKRQKTATRPPPSPPFTIHDDDCNITVSVDPILPQPQPRPPPASNAAMLPPLVSDQGATSSAVGAPIEQQPPTETPFAVLASESLATPSLSLGDSLEFPSWADYEFEASRLLPFMANNPEPAYEAFHDFFLDSIEPKQLPPTYFTSPPAVTVLEPSAVAELYSRSHSPAIDKDAIGPRQYHATSIEVDAQLVFPDLSQIQDDHVLDQEDFAHVEEIPPKVGETVLEHAMELQAGPSKPRFVELRIPPAPVLNAWVQLYFEAFHPVFPFLHKPSFSASSTHWLLIFAVAAIGAHFSGVKNAHACSRAMHELVRRQTSTMCERRNQNGRELWMVQTILLNQLGLMYSGERRGLEVAEIFQALPVTLARRKRIFTSTLSSEKVSELQLPLAQKWQLWVLDGERGRTGFAVWLLDCAFEDHFDLSRLMTLGELGIPLPRPEESWAAPNAQSWMGFGSASDFNKHFTLEQVIAGGKWKAAWSKTNTIGKQVMLQYLTSLVKEHSANNHPGDAKFSPEQRQNAADTLEALLALSENESSQGHFSEIKATLVQQIIALAGLMIHNAPTCNLTTIALKVIHGHMEQETWLWITEQWRGAPEQEKMAVFYAARLFHLVRSNRCAHFGTPAALVRAVLVLWLYSRLRDPARSDHQSASEKQQQHSPAAAVLLGPKPLDEMDGRDDVGWGRVKLPGIGSILHAHGRCKLLDEAITVMKGIKAWGISTTYAQLLTRLRACENSAPSDQQHTENFSAL